MQRPQGGGAREDHDDAGDGRQVGAIVQEGKAKEFGIDRRHAVAERDADGQPEHSRGAGKHEREFHVVPADRPAVEAQRLGDADLGPLQLDDPHHRCVQKKERHAQEDGRHEDTDGAKLLELARDESMRVLPAAIMNIGAGVRRQQTGKRFGHGGGRCVRVEPDGKIVEPIGQTEGRRQFRALHPDNGEATVVGDDLSRSERKNVFGRESDAGNREDPLVSADRQGEPTACPKTVGHRKAFVDHDLPRTIGRGTSALAQGEGVDLRIVVLRQRYQPAGDRLVEAIDRDRAIADDPRRHRRHARDPADGLDKRQGRLRNRGEQVGESLAPVVILARGVERTLHAERHAHGGRSARQHEDDTQRLAAERPQIAGQLAIEDLHRPLPRQVAGPRARRVAFGVGHDAVGELNDAVRHAANNRVVGHQDDGSRERAVHAIERLEHEHTRLAVQRAGGFVAQQQTRLLGDSACDGDALLLAAGKLGGKAVAEIGDADQGQRLHRRQSPLGADGPERHVLAGRQARDEIVGLKNEADMAAPVEGQRPLVERRKVGPAKQEAAGCRAIEATDEIEQRRLAASGWTEQDDEVAARQLEIDAAQGADGPAGGLVGLDQIAGGQHGGGAIGADQIRTQSGMATNQTM